MIDNPEQVAEQVERLLAKLTQVLPGAGSHRARVGSNTSTT
jgi:hypothetical protein